MHIAFGTFLSLGPLSLSKMAVVTVFSFKLLLLLCLLLKREWKNKRKSYANYAKKKVVCWTKRRSVNKWRNELWLHFIYNHQKAMTHRVRWCACASVCVCVRVTMSVDFRACVGVLPLAKSRIDRFLAKSSPRTGRFLAYMYFPFPHRPTTPITGQTSSANAQEISFYFLRCACVVVFVFFLQFSVLGFFAAAFF